MVVERRDLEPVVERRAHDGIDLVLEQDHVAHDDGPLAGLLERGPGGEPHRRGQSHAAAVTVRSVRGTTL